MDRAAADSCLRNRLQSDVRIGFQGISLSKNISAEQFRRFEDRMVRRACDCAIEVADLAYAAEEED